MTLSSTTLTIACNDRVIISEAFYWLKQRRKHAPANADVWDFLYRYSIQNLPNSDIISTLILGDYRLSPMLMIKKQDQTYIAMWSASDAFILKIVALILLKEQVLPVSRLCTHVKGHSTKHHLATIEARIKKGYKYVYRTDIASYYANIDKYRLLEDISKYVKEKYIINLITQYIFYTVERGGNFFTPSKGICRGCPLSPLIAGFHLRSIDKIFEGKSVYYNRYMDDFLILAKTRWQLKHAIARLRQQISAYGFALSYNKTQIGSVEKGFDWLGFMFTNEGRAGPSTRAIQNRDKKACRLYEQAKRRGLSPSSIVEPYLSRWDKWSQR